MEVLGDRRLVYGDMTVRDEALVLLMSHYPDPVSAASVKGSLDRRSPGSVTNTLTKLWRDKLVHRRQDNQLVLTEAGLREAIRVAEAHVA